MTLNASDSLDDVLVDESTSTGVGTEPLPTTTDSGEDVDEGCGGGHEDTVHDEEEDVGVASQWSLRMSVFLNVGCPESRYLCLGEI